MNLPKVTLPKERTPLYYALFALSVGIPLISSTFGWLGLIPLAVALFLIRDEYSALEAKNYELSESLKTFRKESSEQINELSQATSSLSESVKALDSKIASLPTPERSERIIERIEGSTRMPLTYAALALMCVAALFAYRALDKKYAAAASQINQAQNKITSLETHLSSTNIRVSESLSKIKETLDSHVKRLELLSVRDDAPKAIESTPKTAPIIRDNSEQFGREPKTKVIRSPSDLDKAQLGISPASNSKPASLPFRSFKEDGR